MHVEPTHHPGLYGAFVATVSSAISFFALSLIVVQWLAGFVAVVAGTLSIAYTIKHWKTGPRR
jgi:hypothetical protein